MSDADERVHRLFGTTPVAITESDAPRQETVTRDFVATARAISAICATRILLLIAVVTGAAIWAFAVYAPSNDRLAAAAAYSILFVLPQVMLYFRKG